MPELDTSTLAALSLGAIILFSAWLPLIVRKLPLSLPIIAVGVGYTALPSAWIVQNARTLAEAGVLERVTEYIVLIALMGAGLRVERSYSWRKWQAPIRLLGIAMPMTIAAMTAVCHFAIDLSWAEALLISGALASTDPVLAADVQLRPPGKEEGGETRFAITAEAGLNDGLAFPFVLLAMAITKTPLSSVWQHWLLVDLVWKVGCGALVGYLAGRAFGWLTFRLPRLKLSRTGNGLVAVGVTLISYGLATLVNANGFVAVFITAVILRSADKSDDFQFAMAEFSEQIERVLMVLVLLVFGCALAAGLLEPIRWKEVAAGLVLLFVLRPVFGWISLIGTSVSPTARVLMAFFGIRGLAAFYYLAYATTRSTFQEADRLWAIASLVVLVSVLVHGITSTPAMNWADRHRGQVAKASKDSSPAPSSPVAHR